MMERDSLAGLFNVNRSVTSLGSVMRQFRLPTQHPFPKLDSSVVRPAVITAGGVLAVGRLPEMVSDLMDVSAAYAVENVKRDHARTPGLVGRVGGAGPQVVRP